MAEEQQVESAYTKKDQPTTNAVEAEEVVEGQEEAAQKVEMDWSQIPEAELSAIIKKRTGIKLEGLAGMQKVLDEVKQDRKDARAENHELREFKDRAEVLNASDKRELESIYEKRIDELAAKQDSVIQQAQSAQIYAESSMKDYILEAKALDKLNGLVEPDLASYIAEDIKKDFGVGPDNNLYRLEDIDGQRVVGKASFDDEFEEWFGKHRLSGFKLEGGIKGSGSRTGGTLKDKQSIESMAEGLSKMMLQSQHDSESMY